MIAAPARAAAIPSAAISSTGIGIVGCSARPQAPFSAASIHTLPICLRCGVERLDLGDHPVDQAQSVPPKFRITRIETEGLQQLRMMLAAAGGEHVKVALGKTFVGAFVDRVKRVHEAIAEGV